jgi:hypothetical protein
MLMEIGFGHYTRRFCCIPANAGNGLAPHTIGYWVFHMARLVALSQLFS